jgi:hypothetical protein
LAIYFIFTNTDYGDVFILLVIVSLGLLCPPAVFGLFATVMLYQFIQQLSSKQFDIKTYFPLKELALVTAVGIAIIAWSLCEALLAYNIYTYTPRRRVLYLVIILGIKTVIY